MSKTKEYAVIFLLGGVIYSAVEVVTRGFTHWSMTIAGGICLMIIYHHFLTHPDDGILSFFNGEPYGEMRYGHQDFEE